MPVVVSFPIKYVLPPASATFTLRLYNNKTWTDELGVVHLIGTYQSVEGAIVNGVGTVPNFSFPATTTSQDNPRINGVIYDDQNREVEPLFENWEVPAEPDPLTWVALRAFNKARRRRLGDKYVDRDDLFAILASYFSTANPRIAKAMGVATLNGGAAIVLEPLLTDTAIVELTGQDGDVSGTCYVAARDENTGAFTIQSTNDLDSGKVGWLLYEPA